MDYVFSPWRYRYVGGLAKDEGCVFCIKSQADQDEKNLVVFRGAHSFVLLNLYPYTSGHVMIAPYEHVGDLLRVSDPVWTEMGVLTRKCVEVLNRAYRPEGINLGMNLGKSAGAGIADHVHMHVVPRWHADANFMSVIGETRVLPESLEETYRRLKPLF